MSDEKFFDNIMKIGAGIEVCLEKKLDLPALVLFYSGIDVAGWLDSTDEYASERTFKEWADAYLLKAKALKCTALDLWAARCGLVHTLAPYSRPVRKEQPRLISYVHGSAQVEDMQRIIELRGDSKRYVAVHLNDLFVAWRLGVLHFTQHVELDLAAKARVYAKAKRFFVRVDTDEVNRALVRLEAKP